MRDPTSLLQAPASASGDDSAHAASVAVRSTLIKAYTGVCQGICYPMLTAMLYVYTQACSAQMHNTKVSAWLHMAQAAPRSMSGTTSGAGSLPRQRAWIGCSPCAALSWRRWPARCSSACWRPSRSGCAVPSTLHTWP
jgi:hypothetical protein